MKLHTEFAVALARERVLPLLSRPSTLEKLFPGTRVQTRARGVLEATTPIQRFGAARELRILIQPLADGALRFEKVCDGNVWRFLDGRVTVEAVDDAMSIVRIAVEGQTKSFVPELTIRAPLREQLEQIAKLLRRELERD